MGSPCRGGPAARGCGTQLAAAQQREVQVHQDAEDAHGMFEDLSARTKLDEEEIARLQKERDELL